MRTIIKVCIGLFLFGMVLYLSPIEGKPLANKALAVTILMVTWWVSNAIHFALTALIPIVVLPLLGIAPISSLTQAYFNRLLFLLLGGFLIAATIQKWRLHKRIALHIIMFIGIDLKKLVLGFMLSSAFLSMWVTNTATTMMMLPIGVSVIGYIKQHNDLPTNSQFPAVLMLSIAYASSIGGMATLIGTAPNAITAAFAASVLKVEIGFINWFCYGFPIVLFSIPLSYLVLTRIAFKLPGKSRQTGEEALSMALAELKTMQKAEKTICVIFVLVVIGWVFQPVLSSIHPLITDASIALIGGGMLFLIPANQQQFILSWKDVIHIPWSIIILLGGGLALAIAIKTSGLATQIASLFYFARELNFAVLLLLVLITIVTLSEFTSNTATTAAFIPITATVASELNYNPILLIIPATFAASCAFMLPVATPPNAIVFGSRYITISQMGRAGIYLNILFVIILFCYGMSLWFLID